MMIINTARLVVAVLALTSVSGHLDLSPQDMAEYHQLAARGAEAISACLQTPELQELNKRMLGHRLEDLYRLRKARAIDIEPRELRKHPEFVSKYIHKDHQGNEASSDPQDLFGFKWENKPSAKKGCILAPENIYGPFWHNGHLERQDISAGQEGGYMRVALQVLDVATCKPLEDARVDLWHANAVGDYSATNTSWLRGWQSTSNWGTVNFDTIFPGYYAGRTTHLHVAVRPKGARVQHVGQIFFDQAVQDAFDKLLPYQKNKNPITTNGKDHYVQYSASAKHDPFANWAFLNPVAKNSIVAWTVLGLNLSDPTIHQPPNQKRRFLDDHLQY